MKYCYCVVLYQSQALFYICFNWKEIHSPNLTPEIVLREFMWLLDWEMFSTTDKIFTKQNKNGSKGLKRTTVKNISNCLISFYLWSIMRTSGQLSMKFASLTKTFRDKNRRPNILINWRLHVTNYFTTICQDMSFLVCTYHYHCGIL